MYQSSKDDEITFEELRRRNQRLSRFGNELAELRQGASKKKKSKRQKKRRQGISNWDTGLSGEEQMDFSKLKVVGTCQRLEKSYFRLGGVPLPEEVRPQPVLERALVSPEGLVHLLFFLLFSFPALFSFISPSPLLPLPVPGAPQAMVLERWTREQDYDYACDQLKSMRQDLTVQHINNVFAIRVYEVHARIALIAGDFSEYNQCQTQLWHFYHAPEPSPHATPKERAEFGDPQERLACLDEFTAYRLLYFAIMDDKLAYLETLRQFTAEDRARPEVNWSMLMNDSFPPLLFFCGLFVSLLVPRPTHHISPLLSTDRACHPNLTSTS